MHIGRERTARRSVHSRAASPAEWLVDTCRHRRRWGAGARSSGDAVPDDNRGTAAIGALVPSTSSTTLDATPVARSVHRSSTPRRVTILDGQDTCLHGQSTSPVAPTTRPPRPLWVSCFHGMMNADIDAWYSTLSGEMGCGECSIMAFFAMSQYNPEGYDEAVEIMRRLSVHRGTGRPIRNVSAWLAASVEESRRRIYPDGNEFAGMQSLDVNDLNLW